MTRLTDEEKRIRKRSRFLEKACEYQTSTYLRKFVAPLFQRVIRAEYGASTETTAEAVIDGVLCYVPRKVGQCVCVTCGKVQAWDSGIKGMHCGHFLASRRNSIVLEEDNVAPQCSHCNYYASGVAAAFRHWMEQVRGIEVIERLERLKSDIRKFSREELVDLRLGYLDRLKAAVDSMTVSG